MFLLASLDSIPLQFNLKCEPEKAIELREEYEAVQPGYHMNKKHWNTVVIDGETGATSIPGVFAGGDIASGPDIAIRAIAGGKRAAFGINQYLRSK